MDKKKVTFWVLTAVAVYGAIYFYQRYKRNKANESVVSYDEAIKKLEELE